MPSLRTRQSYDRRVLASAQEALSDAATAVAEATTTLNGVQDTLADLSDGTLDLDAITVGGVRFEESGGNLVAIP